MAIPDSMSRLAVFYKRHGFRATIRRAVLALKRALFSSRMAVFYCDLDKQSAAPVNMPSSLKIERLGSYAELDPRDLQEMISFWNPRQAHRDIRERFGKAASLWLIKSADQLAGYSWTIRGRAVATYYFPLAQDDVQLFDFYVFPKFRGRAILWFLIADILQNLKAEGATRVFGDVAEWNQPSLSFYKMTPFRLLGMARSFSIFGRNYVSWSKNEAAEQTQKKAEQDRGRLTMVKSDE